ncbi:signal peptide peptidase SppA [Xanthomonas campestris pv. raphani]|uniref:signal peptide peptidase SppA n=1 Tax=Xanthomonas campestris TaxID=339 RepID=UPI00236858BF|nr:signal peptide peptidase SppA [Xanthomonas campestris]MEA9824700.1 signal peptide peptidase SppA [Xanthomonas campestris pv. raphani]MEA9853076.1 signal peptide peptidase SppA [Xanthomonas campestris pv. raphani]MEA9857234.1 signal peptide peptidase SppA [Xanthomonas campestris pv. raphani]MEA9966198.1 signal peptide peptidase SppA [Xanthomonas campestris pv. raphani]WDJ22076.1 signal peptide peptidase SppA [Xanthomonas campestris pv. raphani]
MNHPVRRNPIATFFVGLWDVMNFTRRLIFNLVFFGFLFLLLLLFVVAIARGDGTKPLAARTTLVIAPEGTLVEQFSADPVSRSLAKAVGDKSAEEVQLRDLLRVIEAAGKDSKIERVLLNLDKLQPSGFASQREVAKALQGLRASGKQIVAFSESMSQGQYLLAAQANEVYLDPMGSVLLEGLGRYRQYFREGLQDKLGVDVHLFRVGEYKSAAEPYILDAASADAKEADLFWMNDVWQRYLADVATARKLSPAQLAAGIDTLPEGVTAAGGDLAKFALQQKLVDGLKTREQVDSLLTERGVADNDADGGFRSIDFGSYLTQLQAQHSPMDSRPQVAVVVAAGEISGGEQPAGRIGGESTAALLRQARDDEEIKAVVLRVDSPGGEVFASEQIRREVVALKQAGKPVVVSMGDLAASGGYWISMNADRIYADPSTISGSIGIFGMVPNLTRALDKIGVHTDGVGTTRFAGAFDITRPLDPAAGQVIQAVINKGYADFTGKVAQARHQSVEAIDKVARGRVWSGAQAKDHGLVDAFGGMQEAVADAASRAKLSKGKFRVRYVEKAATPFSQFMSGFAGSRLGAWMLSDSGMARALLARSLPEVDTQLRFVEDAVHDSKAGGTPVKALAYCFCGF